MVLKVAIVYAAMKLKTCANIADGRWKENVIIEKMNPNSKAKKVTKKRVKFSNTSTRYFKKAQPAKNPHVAPNKIEYIMVNLEIANFWLLTILHADTY